MHTIKRRKATAEEGKLIVQGVSSGIGSCILILVVLFTGGGIVIGLFKGLILHRTLLGLGFGLLLGGAIALAFRQYQKKSGDPMQLKQKILYVEEVDARCKRGIQLVPALDDADDPAFCLDIGEGSLLLLRGQWLMDPQALGAPKDYQSPDEGADTANFLPEPYAFPRSEFRLVRSPDTGSVLSLTLAGNYLAPEKEVDALKPQYPMKDSLIIPGGLDHLNTDFERYFSARKT